MNTPFTITPLTCEFLQPHALNPDAPHRHDHEELWIITHGEPSHTVDFAAETLESPVIVYIARGKVHSFIPDEKTQGWLIRYNTDFVETSRFSFYSGFSDKVQFGLDHGYCSTTLNTLCDLMLKERTNENPDFTVIRHLLSAVLAKLGNDSRREYLEERKSSNPRILTFNSFLQILESNYRRPEGVDFYADKLNMSSRNLNLITQAVFGRSATEIIETRKLTEAKRLLLTSGKSVSEIGFELGYNEKSYFTRVFRKKTGVTPTAFREESFELIS